MAVPDSVDLAILSRLPEELQTYLLELFVTGKWRLESFVCTYDEVTLVFSGPLCTALDSLFAHLPGPARRCMRVSFDPMGGQVRLEVWLDL